MAALTDKCPRCGTGIRSGLVACKGCWYALPEDIRTRINQHFTPGQTALTASADYRAAYRAALEWFTANPISEVLRQQLADSLDVRRQNR